MFEVPETRYARHGEAHIAYQVVGSGGFTVDLPVSLSTPAPPGGVTVMLSSADTSNITVTPSVFIAGGATTPAKQPQITGALEGFSLITASAPGYA